MFKDNFLISLFIYFAKFPKRSGIQPMFNLGKSTLPGYDELKLLVENMDVHSLTDIDHYIFGSSQDDVVKKINAIPAGDTFLFVDFGPILCDTDNSNILIDSAQFAITVGYSVRKSTEDLVGEALAYNYCLEKLTAIRKIMFNEQRCHPWLNHISEKHIMTPFVPEKNINAFGWALIFDREGVDSFNMK